MLQIKFSVETQYGRFSDALYLPDDHAYTEAEIESMKQQRVDNWIIAVSTPAVEEIVEDATETPSQE